MKINGILLAGLDKAFAQVYKVLKEEGTFLICNESCGKNQGDEK